MPVDATPAAALREVARALVGAETEQRPDTVVWLVRLARAAVDESVAAAHRTQWQQVEDLLARLLGAARTDLAPDDVRDGATTLLALLDGLATALAVEPARVSAERAQALVDGHLDRLLGDGAPALESVRREERRRLVADEARAVRDDPEDLAEIAAVQAHMAALREG